jgi:hypothetical protein
MLNAIPKGTNSNNDNSNIDNDNSNYSDFTPPDYDNIGTTVDWDAEWKKLVQKEQTSPVQKLMKDPSSQRPGNDFYKSEAEIAAIVRTRYI